MLQWHQINHLKIPNLNELAALTTCTTKNERIKQKRLIDSLPAVHNF